MKKLMVFLILVTSLSACVYYPLEESLIVSVFRQTDTALFSKYQNRVDSTNVLVKAWHDYSVERTPKNSYIVKVYNDLDSLVVMYTFQDEELLKRTGKAIQWTDERAKIFDGYFMNNSQAHDWQFYNLDHGYLEKAGKYFNGKRKGLWKVYDKTGAVIKEEFYVKGKLENTPEQADSINYITPILQSCTHLNTAEAQLVCTDEKMEEWLNTIKTEIQSKKLKNTLPSLSSLKIQEDGTVIFKILTSMHTEIRQILEAAFSTADIEFVPLSTGEQYEQWGLSIRL